MCNLSQEYKWNLTFKNHQYISPCQQIKGKKKYNHLLDVDKASVKFTAVMIKKKKKKASQKTTRQHPQLTKGIFKKTYSSHHT